LAKRSELGYVDHTSRALGGEPEAVSSEEQEALTLRAHRHWQEQAQREWGKCRRAILDATASARTAGIADRRVLGSLRAIERSVSQVDRRVGLDL
jgi:hypothetical protein